jgi:hypothetical protein
VKICDSGRLLELEGGFSRCRVARINLFVNRYRVVFIRIGGVGGVEELKTQLCLRMGRSRVAPVHVDAFFVVCRPQKRRGGAALHMGLGLQIGLGDGWM